MATQMHQLLRSNECGICVDCGRVISRRYAIVLTEMAVPLAEMRCGPCDPETMYRLGFSFPETRMRLRF
jgi:hypothetical protein